jgi:hypothetical protein
MSFKAGCETMEQLNSFVCGRKRVIPILKMKNAPRFEKMKSSSFTLTLKQWTANTGAIGITSKQGKNGGTLAHPDIACEFNMRLNPAFRLEVIKSFEPRVIISK